MISDSQRKQASSTFFVFLCAATSWFVSLWMLCAGMLYVLRSQDQWHFNIDRVLGFPFGPETIWLVLLGAFSTLIFVSMLLGFLFAKCLREDSSTSSQDQVQLQFLSDISHDVRTPLTSVRGYVETLLMRGDAYSSDERSKFLEIALNNIQQLSNLLDELFDFTRVHERVGTGMLSTVDITEMVSSIGRRLAPAARDKSIDFQVLLPKQTVVAIGEHSMLDRAITNVVNNAIYYTPDEGKVEISLSSNKHRVQIRIKDNGIGIPKQDLSHIFNRFYRVNKDRSRDTGGTGLGLAITKTVVEAHHGEITIESVFGQGTVVTIELPLK